MYKTRAERATEGVEILKKLRDLVNVGDPAYVYTKEVIIRWIQEGETIKESIHFPRYGRRLDLLLPKKKIHAAQAVFKVIDEATRQQLISGDA